VPTIWGQSHSTRSIHDVVGAGVRTGTFTFSERVIMRGEDGTSDDLYFRSVAHFTFNANGEFVVSKLASRFECR
jgi:hypothetical protein